MEKLDCSVERRAHDLSLLYMYLRYTQEKRLTDPNELSANYTQTYQEYFNYLESAL